MPNIPTFNNFSFNDTNWITQRIEFKGWADREVIRGKINRREGVKLLATEFGEKKITLEGVVVASGINNLQLLLDNMKAAVTIEEGSLVLETGRTYSATVDSIDIPDEHYSQSKTDFAVTFVCSQPFSIGTLLSVTIPVTSGIFTLSGTVTISGSLFARPQIIYTPPSATGQTLIKRFDIYHVQTGQTTTVSGFGSGTSLNYQNTVTVNLDNFTTLEGTTLVNTTGGFPRFEPGVNNFTITASGRVFPGGSVSISYQPRYL